MKILNLRNRIVKVKLDIMLRFQFLIYVRSSLPGSNFFYWLSPTFMALFWRNKGALPYRVPLCGPCSFTRRPCQEFRHSGMEVIILASFNFLLWLDFRLPVFCRDLWSWHIDVDKWGWPYMVRYTSGPVHISWATCQGIIRLKGKWLFFRWTICVLVFFYPS